ncbi:hypothetical protein VN0637_14610 [Helicobacter pylori]
MPKTKDSNGYGLAHIIERREQQALSDGLSEAEAKEYIDIASGFHKLFKNDAKIAESLKPATTKNLSQGLATTLSGALKYQWTKFMLGTLYRNAPDRILGIKLPKALKEATAGAALKYHIQRALERSHRRRSVKVSH